MSERVCRSVPLFAVVAIVFVSACAHRPESLVSPGGRLDVINGLPEPVEVFVSGGRVALLEPGATAYLDRLPRRDVVVDVVAVVSGEEYRRRLDLAVDDPVRWHVRQTQAQQTERTSRMTGVLILENRSREPVRPSLNGRAVELVYPDARAVFTGLALGRVAVDVVGVKTAFRLSANLDIAAGTTGVFVVEPPAAALRIRNGADLGVRVHLSRDGDETTRMLAPGAAWVVRGLVAGEPVRIVGDDALKRPFWRGTVTPEIGRVVEVTIPSPSGMLAVVSEFDEPATILADGRLLGVVPPQGAGEFQGLVPGKVRVQAFSASGTVLARSRISVDPDAKPLWFLRPGSTREADEDEGGLLVVNATDEPLEIRIDGWDRGRIEPGQRRRFEGLLPGAHAVAAAAVGSRDVFRMQVELVKGAQPTWTVLPRNATLSLHNPRDEAVRVLVDEEPRVQIAPGSTRELDVPSGERMIEAVGVETLASVRHRMDLPAAAVTRLDLARPFAAVRVTNRQSGPVEVSSEQGVLGIVGPGEAVVFDRLPPGHTRLRARSVDLPVTWNILAWLVAGDVHEWPLGAPGTP